MQQRNKEGPESDRFLARLLKRWRRSKARALYEQAMRGVAYGVGSGAVSLIVAWVVSRY